MSSLPIDRQVGWMEVPLATATVVDVNSVGHILGRWWYTSYSISGVWLVQQAVV